MTFRLLRSHSQSSPVHGSRELAHKRGVLGFVETNNMCICDLDRPKSYKILNRK